MICDTLCCMITLPGGAEMIFWIRSAARSTSGSQSLHAVIDFVRHSSKNSARSSLACSGTHPSECEMKCTHSSSAGNSLRYSSRLSATSSDMQLAYHNGVFTLKARPNARSMEGDARRRPRLAARVVLLADRPATDGAAAATRRLHDVAGGAEGGSRGHGRGDRGQ